MGVNKEEVSPLDDELRWMLMLETSEQGVTSHEALTRTGNKRQTHQYTCSPRSQY